MKTQERKPVIINLSAESGAKEAKNLYAHVVDRHGKLIESTPFKGLQASLKLTREELEGQARVYIAQGVPGHAASKLNERTLLKAKAYQVVQNFSGSTIDVLRVPPVVLQPWVWNNCLVAGHLSKDFLIDGQWVSRPVCNARVHICEVETELVFPHIPIHYRKIPDWVIGELRDRFAHLVLPGIELPNIPERIEPISQPFAFSGRPPAPLARPLMKTAALPEIPGHVLRSLTSKATETVREAIYANQALLHPYFCLWPVYWPWLYTCDEETVVYSDCDGHFEMWENTFTEDGPLNIYVWVEANIDGEWVTVYRPSLPCHTRWNYTCGTDIGIKVTDPRVMPCDCSIHTHGEIAWFRSIGESATALHIEQDDNSEVSVQGGVSLRNVGCTDIIDPKPISPFGGTLNFRLLFGDGLPTAGITHYRWKRTRIKDANLNDIPGATPKVINGNVTKNYFVITQSGGLAHFETHAISLGAEGSGENIGYRIPHWDIHSEPLIPAADQALTLQWTSPDFWSASIDSHALDDGLYTFELELGTMNGGVFQAVAVPKTVFQVSEHDHAGNSVPAPDHDLRIDPAHPANATALVFKVRIDNAPCSALIENAVLTDGAGHLVYVDGAPVVSGRCGFIKYTSATQGVRVSFHAVHPRNFATFSFGVVKGNGTESTGVSASGYVLSGVDGFALGGGLFTRDVPVQQLLGTCPQAAFSENLYVRALATDGTFRLHSGYDASDVKAFALSNT